jgi:predicted DNA-binding transcriptional regulator AlpA
MAVKRAHLDMPRRGLNRVEAAIYVGVSPSTFDKMVADYRMPKPKQIGERLVWDIHQLDACFDGLPERYTPTSDAAPAPAPRDSFSDYG